MAEGRRPRGWRVVGNGDRYTARLSDFAAALQRLPPLRLRPLGTALADAPDHRRCCCGPLRGRHGAGVPASRRRGAIPPRMEGTPAEVRSGTPPGQDPPDRVWAVRGPESEATG